MEFAAVFVAMSRVQQKDHLKLLVHRHIVQKHNPKEAYDYVTHLTPDINVIAFYNGYEVLHNGALQWNPTKALS